MTDLHLALGLLALAASVAAAAWGATVVARRRPSRAFLPIARGAQGIVLAQLLLGILLLTGAGADEALPSGAHILAAGGVLAALATAEALGRIPARRRSTRGDRVLAGVALDDAALAESPVAGVGQTAVLTVGFVAVSGAAALAVATGWH